MSPTKILATVFGRQPGQSLLEFSNEVKALKESCPAQTSGRITSYPDFVAECAKFLGVEVLA